jgi:hypothetical protein
VIDQFFGKTFWVGLTIMVALFLVSIGAYAFHISLPVLLLVIFILIMLTVKNPTFGLFGVFLELFSNPHGHLIFWDDAGFLVSLRMAVFIGFFIGYTIFLIRTKSRVPLSPFSSLFPLLLAILIGFTSGFLFQDPIRAFTDGNAYFFLLYAIPILGHAYSSKDRSAFFQILAAGAIWNMIISFGILYLFTHFNETFLQTSYVFLRDVRLAEITNIGRGFYRVFIQSQFFVIVFGTLLIPLYVQLAEKRDRILISVLLGGVISTLLLSLSRSFWIGVGACLIVFMVLLIRSQIGRDNHGFFNRVSFLFLSVLFSILFIAIVIFFPFPTQKLGAGDLADVFSKRAQTDVAISSRWKLIDPMSQAIREHPFIGNGFGASVSFVSDDPRVREMYPDGVWSTSSMEWGWLELWLKMGILGPISFLILFGFLLRQLFGYLKTDRAWIGIGFISSLIFLYVTNAFSPYLNHPIGLGFLLFVFLFLSYQPLNVSIEARIRALPHIQKEMPEPASALSLQAEEK